MTGDIKLADAVRAAVAEALDGEYQVAVDAVEPMLPDHVRLGRPSKKLIGQAVIDAGWHRVRVGDAMFFRAPQAQSDPLVRRGEGDNISAQQLRLFIERIERLEEEKKGIADDIKDVYGEMKSTGFCTKTTRTIIKLRKMEKHHRDEAEAMIDTYKSALGMS